VTTWAIIIAIGLGTYLLRVSMLVLLAGRSLPGRARTAIGFVGPAALGGLVSSMLFGSGASAGPIEVASVGLGFVVVRRSGNVLHAIIAGLPVYVALTLASGGW
jgi:branched-subunit amino acid transport protein